MEWCKKNHFASENALIKIRSWSNSRKLAMLGEAKKVCIVSVRREEGEFDLIVY